MLIWSSLIWNILTHEEVCRQFYEKERQIHILGDRTCEAYLNQMEQQGLIVSGHGVTGADALYDDEETTYRNIGQLWRGCEANNPVLSGIATLHLNKHIIFDVLE